MLSHRLINNKLVMLGMLVLVNMVGICGEAVGAEKKRIAVLNLESTEDPRVFEKNLIMWTDVIRTVIHEKLSATEYLLLTQENITQLVEEPLEKCLEATCQVMVGRQLGVQYIVTGKFMKFGSEYRVSLKLHDTVSGEMLSSQIVKSHDIFGIEGELVKSLGNNLIKKLMPDLVEMEEVVSLQEYPNDLKFEEMVEKRVRPTDENSHNVQKLMNMCRTGMPFEIIMNTVKVNGWFSMEEWGNLQSLSDEVMLKFGFEKKSIQKIKSFKKSDITDNY